MAQNFADQEVDVLLDISESARNSVAFTVPDWVTFVGVFIPTFTVDDNVGLEVSRDGGSTYVPVLDPTDGDDLLICKTGSDPGYIDLSQYMAAFLGSVANTTPYKFRFVRTAADETTSDKTYRVVMRG